MLEDFVITKDKALSIAEKHAYDIMGFEILGVYDGLPPGPLNIYNPLKDKDIWSFVFSRKDLPGEAISISSSYLICVSKDTGEVIYSGSMNDEG